MTHRKPSSLLPSLLGGWTCAVVTLAVAHVACGGSGDSTNTSGELGGTGAGANGNGQGGTTLFGASGSGSLFIGNGDGGSNSGQGGNGEQCAADTKKAEVVPLDMYIMLDKSGSMLVKTNPDPLDPVGLTRWAGIKAALTSFFDNPAFAGLGVGLQFFPLPAICSIEDHATPAVPIATLPGVAKKLIDIIELQKPEGGTPMITALSGAVAYAKSWSAIKPTHNTIIVLATDGIPDPVTACGKTNKIANTVAVAKDSFEKNNIRTFVIGVGDNLNDLNRIANAGGTERAFLYNDRAGTNPGGSGGGGQGGTGGSSGGAGGGSSSVNTQGFFLDALNKIRKRALSCDYIIPASSGQIDYNKVNVEFQSAPTATKESFFYATSEEDCKTLQPGQGGWYYDDPTQPKKVALCPTTCKRAQTFDEGAVSLLFGCATTAIH